MNKKPSTKFKIILLAISLLFLSLISYLLVLKIKYDYCPNKKVISGDKMPSIALPKSNTKTTYYRNEKVIDISNYPKFFIKHFCEPIREESKVTS